MIKNNNIKGLMTAFDNAREIMHQATKELLEGAFEKRDAYIIPRALWMALEDEGAPTTAWVDYRHYGMNIAVWGVRQNKYQNGSAYYSVYGTEMSDYRQDEVENMPTYDEQECAYFIQWWYERDWDTMLNDLQLIIKSAEDADDILVALFYWASKYSINLDEDCVHMENLMQWAKDYTPVSL